MPSPFPGMDPYLEEPGRWPSVHHGLISSIHELLNAQLRPKYYVRVEERIYISDEDDPGRPAIVPDLRVIESGYHASRSSQPAAVATLEVTKPIIITLLDEEIHEARLNVIDRENRQVVTVIEVVSPTNKIAGSRGRESYVAKRAEILASPSHWMEIDFLRQGTPLVVRNTTPPCEYTVRLSRADQRGKTFLWPIFLTHRLPVVSIPLRSPDPDAKLDLQAALTTTYDRAGYDLEISYRKEPEPPLSPELAGWADELLRSKGLR